MKRKINLSRTDLNREIDRATARAVEHTTWLFLLAMQDELKLQDDQVVAVMERIDRYAGYIDQHLARMKDIKALVERDTGLKEKRG